MLSPYILLRYNKVNIGIDFGGIAKEVIRGLIK